MTNKLMLAAMLALLSSAPALAQTTPTAFDSRWTPYLGCWTIVQGQRGQSAPVPAGTMVCVQPSGRFAVNVTTTVDGKTVLEQSIVADGSAQPLSQGDCTGTQTSNWSRDGERLFTSVELTCANRPTRTVSGITLLANGQWVDAQATLVDGNADVRLRRYRRTSDSYTGPAGMTTAPLSIEDIIEASAKVQSEALEAALDEANARFALNSSVLTQLADNGVSPNVIDLLVAQAYPEKFEVQRSRYPSSSYGTASMGSSSVYMGSNVYPSPMYDPFYSSYYYYYSPFAYPYYWGPSYGYRYGYGSPFYSNYYNNYYYGLGGGGYYGGGYGGVGGGRPRGDNAQPGDPDSRGGDGVVVNGRGYTRVRPAGSSNTGSGSGESATPTSRTPGTARGVRSAGSSGSGSSSTPSPSSSSGSSSSGASSGGYSSGGGGDSSGGGGGGGGRTAQPR